VGRSVVLLAVHVALAVACGGHSSGPQANLDCSGITDGCQCTATFGGHTFLMTCLASLPFSCTCTEDGMSRTVDGVGLCESADVNSDADKVWTDTCGFP
jgi:hypothetical protein